MSKKLNVGILIFDKVEVLDFSGPYEVFSVCSELENHKLFDVFTVANKLSPINANNGLSINPSYSFGNTPNIDILIIPGGHGTRDQIADVETLNWIKSIHKSTTFTISICSGSILLGILRLLDEKPYCTHNEVYNFMKKIVANGKPNPKKRYVKSSERIYTSAGISSGIDLSLHIIELLVNKRVAKNTADYMEYYPR